VISSYFEEKGLVRQQLDSFDEFIHNTMQEVVEEAAPIEVFPEPKPGQPRVKFQIKFGHLYLSSPQMTEKSSTTEQMFPNMARIRNLTYAAPLFVDITKRLFRIDEKGREIIDEKTQKPKPPLKEEVERVWIGRVPLMLKSTYCVLTQQVDKGLTDLGECPYDQGGYFVINGSEKVLIAQERMSSNHVYVFSGKKVCLSPARTRPARVQLSPDADFRLPFLFNVCSRRTSRRSVRWLRVSTARPPRSTSKCRSRPKAYGLALPISIPHCQSLTLPRPPSFLCVQSAISGSVLRAQIPYIRAEIPIMIVFRALGFVSDRDILVRHWACLPACCADGGIEWICD
jgi:DNA-directed RNA polymerase II subunit RPB2